MSCHAPELTALIRLGYLNEDCTPARGVVETYETSEDGRTLVVLTKTTIAEADTTAPRGEPYQCPCRRLGGGGGDDVVAAAQDASANGANGAAAATITQTTSEE